MNVVFLAAGLGSRLGDKTSSIPKALIPVEGRCLIDYSLNHFAQNPDIELIAVVTGYQGDKVAEHVRKKGIAKARVVLNPNYKKGNFYSMWSAKDYLSQGFILMNIDHIYPASIVRFAVPVQNCITGLCDFDRPLVDDDMKVKTDASGNILKISKKLTDFSAGYIGCTVVPKDKVSTYTQAALRTIEKYGDQAVVENVLQELVDSGEPVKISNTSGLRWLEVDTQEDLFHAEKTLRDQSDFLLR